MPQSTTLPLPLSTKFPVTIHIIESSCRPIRVSFLALDLILVFFKAVFQEAESAMTPQPGSRLNSSDYVEGH